MGDLVYGGLNLCIVSSDLGNKPLEVDPNFDRFTFLKNSLQTASFYQDRASKIQPKFVEEEFEEDVSSQEVFDEEEEVKIQNSDSDSELNSPEKRINKENLVTPFVKTQDNRPNTSKQILNPEQGK